jgi:peptide/nickel transport system substrate-binding protein
VCTARLKVVRKMAVLAGLLLTACTYGKSDGTRSATTTTQATEQASTASDPWLDGVLPPEVMQGTPKPGGTLVVRMQTVPPSLDPLTDSDSQMRWMLDRKVYQGMAQLDASKHPDYPLKPVLAEDWEISPDGQTFTFHIRHGVKWHDGKPFSGQDVVATVKKILDPKVRAMHLRNYYEDLDDIHTPPGDDFTVIARFKKPYFLAFRFLATQAIFPKHLLDQTPDVSSHAIHRAPVGTGPFKFVEWDTANQKITMARNEEYWGRKAYLDRVIYRLVKDHTVAFQMLQQGEFDLYTVLQPSMWKQQMPQNPFFRENYNRIRFFDNNYSWIGWNTQRPFFADARVRLAMTYLLDREGLVDQFLLGTDRLVTCHFYRESSSCDPSLTPRPYDPEKAVALLDEAGWIDHDGDGLRDKDGVPFKFTFLATSSSLFAPKLAAYMQSTFRRVGIAVEIKKVDWSIYIQALREHRFDVCFLLWGNTDVVTDPYQIWHSSQAKDGSNYISYANPKADALIEGARQEMDDAKRAEMFRELGRILYDENPYTWISNRPTLDVVRKNVRGIRPAMPWYDLEDVWIEGAK